MNTVACPNCGKAVEITEALKHQIEEQVLKEEKGRLKEELEKQRLRIEQDTEKRIKDELKFQLKDQKNEVDETKKRNQELQNQLLEMNKLIRELKDQNTRSEIENQKKLNQELERMREHIIRDERDKANLEILQLKKKLEDTEKSLTDAQRKAQQVSQQLQGEVLELDLESQLASNFATDEILPVPKGIEGADVWQKVRNRHGQTAGSILWETKRTKMWNKAWLSKLREDSRQIGAHLCILVSDILPEGIDTFSMVEKVWVTSYRYAIPLANVLRIGLLQVAIAKSSAANKDEKLEALYSYLTNDAFVHRFEAQVESIIELQKDLDAERRSTIRIWKKREIQIKRLINNTSSMYGELQGIIGQALPSIKSLDSPLPIAPGMQEILVESS